MDSAAPPLKEYVSIKLQDLEEQISVITREIPGEYSLRGSDVNLLEKLKSKANALFHSLLGEIAPTLQALADHENPQTLLVTLDEDVAFIPFEILHTGQFFLWQVFYISRQITTRLYKRDGGKVNPSKNSFALMGNPSEDPAINSSVREELFRISEELDQDIEITGPIFGANVTTSSITEILNSRSIVHYSGHFTSNAAGESGWQLLNGELFTGTRLSSFSHVPRFIFSNSCGSPDSLAHNGFIRKFIDAGVQAFLTTQGEVPTIQAAWFSNQFYKSLMSGKAIGQSVHLAKQSLVDRFGLSDLAWMFYILVGDPDTVLVQKANKGLRFFRKIRQPLVITAAALVLVWAAGLVYSQLKMEKINIRTQPSGCTVHLNNTEIGKTPLAIKFKRNDVLMLSIEDYDTLTFSASIVGDSLSLSHQLSLSGIISNRSIQKCNSFIRDGSVIPLVPVEYSYLTFENLNDPEATVMVQGNPSIFQGSRCRLAVDPNTFRFIYKSGELVFDKPVSISSDSVITFQQIMDTWPEGRFH